MVSAFLLATWASVVGAALLSRVEADGISNSVEYG